MTSSLVWFRHQKIEKGDLTGFIVFFVLYVLAAQVGVRFFTAPAVVFPAAGLALAFLVIRGVSLWPAIFLGAVTSSFINGAPPFSLFLLPVAHTLQAVAGYFFLKRLNFDPKFGQLRDTLLFMLVGFLVSTVVPTFGMAAQYLNAYVFSVPLTELTWGSWWTGMIVSLFLITPLVVTWYFRRNIGWDRIHPLETLAAFVLLVAINSAFFLGGVSSIVHVSMVYILLVPLFWIALRIGPRFMTLALFMTALFALFGLFFGPSAPPYEQLGARVFQVEIFLNIISVIFLVLVAIEEERKEILKAMKSHVDNLESALNKLSQDDRAKNQFIATLAHELRNPLAPLMSSIELLKIKGFVSAEDKDALGVMDDQVRRMKRLLEDLLDISRISRQKLTLRKETVDLCTAVRHSIRTVLPFFESRKQKLVVDIPNEGVFLDGDEMRLEQVCINLLNNASKFTDAGGTIFVSVKRNKKRVEVRVRDTGIGIEPSLISKIFEPFLQVELGRSSNDGLGIGLSLTKTLVEMHGGTIRALSDGVQKGSEFIVDLPLLSGSPHSLLRKESHPTPEMSSSPKPSLRVLVVDDNTAAAKGIAALLKIKGYVAECAFTGLEAKEKASHFKPDAIVLDIGLPDMDGYAVAQSLRHDLGFTGSIVALTGYGQNEDKERAFNAGFNFHITKPVAIADLETILSTVHKG